jgi:hypothetical protein
MSHIYNKINKEEPFLFVDYGTNSFFGSIIHTIVRKFVLTKAFFNYISKAKDEEACSFLSKRISKKLPVASSNVWLKVYRAVDSDIEIDGLPASLSDKIKFSKYEDDFHSDGLKKYLKKGSTYVSIHVVSVNESDYKHDGYYEGVFLYKFTDIAALTIKLRNVKQLDISI